MIVNAIYVVIIDFLLNGAQHTFILWSGIVSMPPPSPPLFYFMRITFIRIGLDWCHEKMLKYRLPAIFTIQAAHSVEHVSKSIFVSRT